MLQIQNLTVHYGQRRALNNVSLNVQKGELLALLGPNGSGKSTLIRALSGVQRATSGSLSLFGHPLNGLTPTARARLMAVVPQTLSMPPAFTAWETVLLGRTPYLNFLGQISARDEDIARRALEKADALHLADRLVGELSGGEQQRVAVARALVLGPDVVLADEPTGNLDAHTGEAVHDLLQKLNQETGTTFIIVTHNDKLARRADRVLRMSEGLLSPETP
jgi:ABC-type cobalamin/Fe3+-siderophores transport system ATPase subunit